MTDKLPDLAKSRPSNSERNEGSSSDTSKDESANDANNPDKNGNNDESTLKKRTIFNRDLWNLRKKKLGNKTDSSVEIDDSPRVENNEPEDDQDFSNIETRTDNEATSENAASEVAAPVDVPEENKSGKQASTDDKKYFTANRSSPPAASTTRKVNVAPTHQPPAALASWDMAVDQAVSPKVIGEKQKLLYVEDNPDNRLLIQRVLSFEGYDITFAKNAIEALLAAEEKSFDLILMDINLPDIDGYTLTSQLRELPKFNNVPIIALTANVMKGDRERSLEAGCDGYIQKPINIDTLPGQIKEYLVPR